MTKPFLRKAEHCMGKVADAPESTVSKCVSSMVSAIVAEVFVAALGAANDRKETKLDNSSPGPGCGTDTTRRLRACVWSVDRNCEVIKAMGHEKKRNAN